MQVFTVCFTALESLAFWKCPEMYFSLGEFYFTVIIVAFVFDWSLNMSGEWFCCCCSVSWHPWQGKDRQGFELQDGSSLPCFTCWHCSVFCKASQTSCFSALSFAFACILFCFFSFAFFFNAGWMFLKTSRWQQCIVAKIRAVRQSDFDNGQAHWSIWQGNTGA